MLQAFSDFLYIGWLADLVVAWSWFWPILEMLHFIGLALLVGIIGLYDFRLLGVAKSVPLNALNRLIPWALVGFAITATTGFVFVVGNAFKPPIDLFLNLSFQLKMLFLALAGANAAYFYLSPRGQSGKSFGTRGGHTEGGQSHRSHLIGPLGRDHIHGAHDPLGGGHSLRPRKVMGQRVETLRVPRQPRIRRTAT